VVDADEIVPELSPVKPVEEKPTEVSSNDYLNNQNVLIY
jgi:hypothetical protein